MGKILEGNREAGFAGTGEEIDRNEGQRLVRERALRTHVESWQTVARAGAGVSPHENGGSLEGGGEEMAVSSEREAKR